MLPPPPEFAPPPPPFIPPPEVRIAKPPPRPRIVSITRTPPPAPVVIAPAPPAPPAPAPAPPAPPAPRPPAPPPPKPKPAPPVTAGVACANYSKAMGDAAFPREAVRRGLDHGSALIRFTLKPDGRVVDIVSLNASHRIFADASKAIVATFLCQGQGREVIVRVPFEYRLQ